MTKPAKLPEGVVLAPKLLAFGGAAAERRARPKEPEELQVMKVFVSQLYIQPGVSFPFSVHMQRWLHEALSALAVPSPAFTDKYGADFNLIVRLSAKRELKQNEIKGPTVFKREKDVEYTLLLPFKAIIEQGDMCRSALAFLFDGVRAIFARAGIEGPGLDAAKQEEIIEQICSAPDMLDGPWPAPRVSALH